jgi:hypothetical protein
VYEDVEFVFVMICEQDSNAAGVNSSGKVDVGEWPPSCDDSLLKKMVNMIEID